MTLLLFFNLSVYWCDFTKGGTTCMLKLSPCVKDLEYMYLLDPDLNLQSLLASILGEAPRFLVLTLGH